MNPATLYYSKMDSPIGPLILAVTDRGLAALHFDRDGKYPPPSQSKLKSKSATRWQHDPSVTRPYIDQLREYFAGTRRAFDLPLDLQGTDFQKRCWAALLAIPYGETRSYKQIAAAAGSPRGFRAVGMANHHNPVAIIVPCHRVIAADGTLGGYGGGLDVKRRLLQLEGATIAPARASNSKAMRARAS